MIHRIISLVWFCLCLGGCSHVQWVKDTYDPTTHRCLSHEIISSTQVMYFSNRKDIWAKHKQITFSVGSTKQAPEFPPGFLDLLYNIIAAQANTNLLDQEIIP